MGKIENAISWGIVTVMASITSGTLGHYVTELWALPVLGVAAFSFVFGTMAMGG